jgi:CCR4-NOT transcription complex subunit 3
LALSSSMSNVTSVSQTISQQQHSQSVQLPQIQQHQHPQQSPHINSTSSQTLHILHNQQNQNYNNETEITTPVPPSTSPQSSVSSRSSPILVNSCSPAPSTTNGLITKLPDGMSTLKSIAQQVIVRAGLEIPTSEPTRSIFDSCKTNNIINNNNITVEAHIPPLLGVAPLGPVPLQKEHQHQFQMMESAYYHMPHPSDSERLRPYLPRNNCPTPPYYQQVQTFLFILCLFNVYNNDS